MGVCSPFGLDTSSLKIDEILRALRAADAAAGRREMTAPWGLEFPATSAGQIHLMVEGNCWLGAQNIQWTPLAAGDVVFFPRDSGHTLADQPGRPAQSIHASPTKLVAVENPVRREDAAGRVVLACCTVQFEDVANPLIDLMPLVLIARGAAAADRTLHVLLQNMATESLARRAGAETIMTRLADALVLKIMRDWLEPNELSATGWLAAIRDQSLARSLLAIHRTPGDDWTLQTLAAVAEMSRSAFAKRFTSLVGVSPARYLTRLRMNRAANQLRSNDVTVSAVAAHFGYESEAAFCRAFKRTLGVRPSAFRSQPKGVSTRGEDQRAPKSR